MPFWQFARSPVTIGSTEVGIQVGDRPLEERRVTTAPFLPSTYTFQLQQL